VKRESPLNDLALLQREVNQLFERLASLEHGGRAATGEWCPCADVFECSGSLYVVVEVPGLRPESLRVAVEAGELVVSGERRGRRPGSLPGHNVCMERPQGRFTRRLPLDTPVDACRAEATLSRGLLTVQLPLLEDRRGRRVDVPVRREDA
jgi:HSP20 family protein